MRLLCIDTCFDACSVGVFEAHRSLYQISQPLKRGHAEILAPMTKEALRETGLALSDMDRLAVTIGPGSFTGIRVGVAFARGLAIGQDIRVTGVTSLEVLAQGAADIIDRREKKICARHLYAVLIEARHGRVYGQLFTADQTALCAPFETSPADALRKIDESVKHNQAPRSRSVVLAGSGAALVKAECPAPVTGEDPHAPGYVLRAEKPLITRARAGLELAIIARLACRATELSMAAPLYIRAADAQKAR